MKDHPKTDGGFGHGPMIKILQQQTYSLPATPCIPHQLIIASRNRERERQREKFWQFTDQPGTPALDTRKGQPARHLCLPDEWHPSARMALSLHTSCQTTSCVPEWQGFEQAAWPHCKNFSFCMDSLFSWAAPTLDPFLAHSRTV